MLKKALSLLDKGFKIFPCVPDGKIPLTKGGFKDATDNIDQIRAWWQAYPNANIGLPTGQVNGITVIDIDKQHGGEVTWAKWLLSNQVTEIDTMTVTTPQGGSHIYLQYTEGLFTTTNFGEKNSGIDIRNVGGYVIADGSQISKASYISNQNECIASCPTWVLNIVKPIVKNVKPNIGLDNVLKGGRNAYLTKLAGALQRQDVPPETLYHMIMQANEDTCTPMLDDNEVSTICQSVSRYIPDPDEIRISSVVQVSDLLTDMIEHLSDKDKVKGISTGITSLDLLLGGGYRGGELTALHAEAKTGKSTLFHRLIFNAIQNNQPIGYASRELTPSTEVLPELLSLVLTKNLFKDDLTANDLQLAKQCVDKWKLFFASGYGYMPLDDIRQWIIRLNTEFGVKIFFVDHLHYCLEEPEDHKSAAKLARELKTLAKQLDVCINIIIQPNKLMEGQSLGLNSIKGGAAIGQALDNLLTYKRVKNEKWVNKLVLKVARSKLANLGHIHLEYNPKTMDTFEVEIIEEEETESTARPQYRYNN